MHWKYYFYKKIFTCKPKNGDFLEIIEQKSRHFLFLRVNIFKVSSRFVSIIAVKLECCYAGLLWCRIISICFSMIVSIIAVKLECCYAMLLWCRIISIRFSMIVSIIAAKNRVFYTLVIYRMIYDHIITQTPNK